VVHTTASPQRSEIETNPGKPKLLRLAPWLLIPLGLMTFAFAGLMFLELGTAQVGLAPGSPAAEFLSISLGFAFALVLLCASYGLQCELPWARWVLAFGPPMVLIGGALAAMVAISPTAALSVAWSAVQSLVYAGFAVWYLFRKPNVSQYYASLAGRR